MPKFLCNCKNVINLSEIPSPNQLLIISDVELDKFSGMIDSKKLYEKMIIVAACNVCKRLHIFRNGYNQAPDTYYPEEITP